MVVGGAIFKDVTVCHRAYIVQRHSCFVHYMYIEHFTIILKTLHKNILNTLEINFNKKLNILVLKFNY